jgi:hypothetical protein
VHVPEHDTNRLDDTTHVLERDKNLLEHDTHDPRRAPPTRSVISTPARRTSFGNGHRPAAGCPRKKIDRTTRRPACLAGIHE